MRTKFIGVLAGIAMVVGLAGFAAPTAFADDQPTTRQLLDMCDKKKTDFCEFHPEGSPVVYRGSYKLAGGSTNCSDAKLVRVIRWESSTSTTNSFGVTINGGAQLGKIFQAGVETSFHTEWSWSDTQADEVQQEVAPHSGVNVYVAPMKTKINGTYELHFGKRYYGHYYWYVHGAIDGQTKGHAWDVRTESARPNC